MRCQHSLVVFLLGLEKSTKQMCKEIEITATEYVKGEKCSPSWLFFLLAFPCASLSGKAHEDAPLLLCWAGSNSFIKGGSPQLTDFKCAVFIQKHRKGSGPCVGCTHDTRCLRRRRAGSLYWSHRVCPVGSQARCYSGTGLPVWCSCWARMLNREERNRNLHNGLQEIF